MNSMAEFICIMDPKIANLAIIFIYCSHGISEMDSLGISHENCPVYTDFKSPVSYITLNTSNGSRTILHYR